jgi:hypothetical protein
MVDTFKIPLFEEFEQVKLQAGSTYGGSAYRVESNLMVKGKTAKDIVDFEAEELGNTDIKDQAESLDIDLSAIDSEHVVWACLNKSDAEYYLSQGFDDKVIKINIPDGSMVLASDYQGGYLFWLNLDSNVYH